MSGTQARSIDWQKLNAANEWMVYRMAKGASRIYVSTTAWNKRLIQLGPKASKIIPQAIPTNTPTCTNRSGSQEVRKAITKNPQTMLLGISGRTVNGFPKA